MEVCNLQANGLPLSVDSQSSLVLMAFGVRGEMPARIVALLVEDGRSRRVWIQSSKSSQQRALPGLVLSNQADHLASIKFPAVLNGAEVGYLDFDEFYSSS